MRGREEGRKGGGGHEENLTAAKRVSRCARRGMGRGRGGRERVASTMGEGDQPSGSLEISYQVILAGRLEIEEKRSCTIGAAELKNPLVEREPREARHNGEERAWVRSFPDRGGDKRRRQQSRMDADARDGELWRKEPPESNGRLAKEGVRVTMKGTGKCPVPSRGYLRECRGEFAGVRWEEGL